MANWGRYALLRKVGAGGMAEVWKARVQGPAGFHKTLAIKRILPSFNERAELVELLVEEAKIVARLQHPNIVQVFDFGSVSRVEDDEANEWKQEGGGDYFIAMEYVAGQNLSRILNRLARRKAQCSRDIALFIVAEVARGLAYAHSSGAGVRIIHRDVSPHNILISYSGAVKIADFGIAKVENALSRTATGQLKGKLAYMSPEQIITGKVDHRSDLFALGAVLFELVTMDALFRGADAAEIFRTISNYQPVEDPRIRALPEGLRALLIRALAPNPEGRFQDGFEMERALTGALGAGHMLLARRSLVSMMRVVFGSEFEREKAEEEAADAEPVVDESAAETTAAAQAKESDSLPDTTYISVPERTDGTSAPRITVKTLLSIDVPDPGELPDPFADVRDVAPLPEGPAADAAAQKAEDKDAGAALRFAGAACAHCGNVVESFLGDSDLCFQCLDEEDGRAVPDTSYHSTMPLQTGRLADEDEGFLSVDSSDAVEVWIDGDRIPGPMPLRRLALPSGAHHVVLISGVAAFRREETINVFKGAEIHIFVDVQSKTLRRW